MMGGETASDRIRLTRSKLEEQFNAFEKTLLQEISSHAIFIESLKGQFSSAVAEDVSMVQPAARAAAPVPSGRPTAVSSDAEKELLHLRKVMADVRERNKVLEETVEQLRSSLRAMGGERLELSNQISPLEEQIKNFQASFSKLEAENAGLKNRGQAQSERRSKLAALWKRWTQAHRSRGKLAQPEKGDPQMNVEMAKQITRLTSELDASLELIAELRDELHGVGHPNNIQPQKI